MRRFILFFVLVLFAVIWWLLPVRTAPPPKNEAPEAKPGAWEAEAPKPEPTPAPAKTAAPEPAAKPKADPEPPVARTSPLGSGAKAPEPAALIPTPSGSPQASVPKAPEAEPEVAGEPMVWSVDREGIQGAMDESKPKIQECYSAWIKSNPDLAGRMVISFVIEPLAEGSEYGKVTEVELADSDVEHPLLEGCVLNVASELRWTAPPDGRMAVRYPFLFATE